MAVAAHEPTRMLTCKPQAIQSDSLLHVCVAHFTPSRVCEDGPQGEMDLKRASGGCLNAAAKTTCNAHLILKGRLQRAQVVQDSTEHCHPGI